jgi:hypothetical protein
MTTEIRSDAPEGGLTPDPTAPNMERAAAAVAERRGPGRPKGSKNRKSAARAKTSSAASEPDAPAEITEADIRGAAILGSASWKIIGGFFNLRELTKDEARELGEAAAPVMAKYLPDLGEYAPEIGLAITLYALWDVTKIEGPPAAKQLSLGLDGDPAGDELATDPPEYTENGR